MTTIRSHKLRIERDKDGSKIGKCHMHGIRKRNIWMCIGALSDDFVYERVYVTKCLRDELVDMIVRACIHACVYTCVCVCACARVCVYYMWKTILEHAECRQQVESEAFIWHTRFRMHIPFFVAVIVVVSLNKEHFYIRCMTKCLNLIINECGWHFFSRHQNKHKTKQ